jgi:hypothetical protein
MVVWQTVPFVTTGLGLAGPMQCGLFSAEVANAADQRTPLAQTCVSVG